jgi:methionyl-tRNA formyltransferase
MKVSILCTDPNHPVVRHLQEWMVSFRKDGLSVSIHYDKNDLPGGDLLFLVSCSQILSRDDCANYDAVLVLHASDLPKGRGWSPYIWDILVGADRITVCLLEARDSVDTGAIWLRREISLAGHELLSEIHARLFAAEISLIEEAILNYSSIEPEAQHGDPGPYFRRRTPEDSRLDPNKTIAQQFDLMRVTDPQRFPAFFDYRGHRYLVKLEKAKNG